VLAIDTATRLATLALGDASGRLLAGRAWAARRGHSETLLDELERLLHAAGVDVRSLAGIVAGIGPGAFTGLRVGLATAKTLAYALGRPISGVGTAEALALAGFAEDHAADRGLEVVVLQPAGPSDRYLTRCRVEVGSVSQVEPPLLVPGSEPLPASDGLLLAVDLDQGAGVPHEAIERGRVAQEGLGAALLRLGTVALAERPDDVSALDAAYVTLPRGVPAAVGGREWSPDLR
jgi:tRNA threonylcarbamoyladenosine biosynthesis protein TsaB